MSFLRNASKNQLKRSVSCVCFSRHVWQNPNHVVKDIELQLTYRTFSRTSCLAKKKSDYYAELGVAKESTALEIKHAYYELSKKFHPDRNKGSNEAAMRFRDIKEAYEVLGNHSKRRRYDKGQHFPILINNK